MGERELSSLFGWDQEAGMSELQGVPLGRGMSFPKVFLLTRIIHAVGHPMHTSFLANPPPLNPCSTAPPPPFLQFGKPASTH